MQRTMLPEAPWDYLAMDFCGPYRDYGGISILGLVDYHSRFVIAAPTKSTDTLSVKAVLANVFDIFGNPEKLKCDNATCFTSSAFTNFCLDRGIEIVHSWPLNPQQNGAAENTMKLVNKAMEVSKLTNIDYEQSLRETVGAHNSSRHTITNEIPSDVMFGRKLRRSLPLMKSAENQIDKEQMFETDWARKLKAKHREDTRRGAREPKIREGDKVLLRREAPRKGETPYGPTEYEVVRQIRGDLTLLTPDGNEVRRDITKAKRINEPALQPQLETVRVENQEPVEEQAQDIEDVGSSTEVGKILRKSVRLANLKNKK